MVVGSKVHCYIVDWVAVDSKAFAVVAVDIFAVGGYNYSPAVAVAVDIAVAGAAVKDIERCWEAVVSAVPASAVDSCMTEMTPAHAEWTAFHSIVRVP